MIKVVGMMAVLLGMSSMLMAAVPEIDPSSSGAAVALLLGGMLVIRGRKK